MFKPSRAFNRISGQAARITLFEQTQQAFYEEMPGLLFADVDAIAVTRRNVQSFKLHFPGGQPFGDVSLVP